MDQIHHILKDHGFSLKEETFHSPEDIERYKNLPDLVSEEKFLTIFSKEGYVMGRLFHKNKSNVTIDSENFEKLMTIFSIYDIGEAKKVFQKLKALKH